MSKAKLTAKQREALEALVMNRSVPTKSVTLKSLKRSGFIDWGGKDTMLRITPAGRRALEGGAE